MNFMRFSTIFFTKCEVYGLLVKNNSKICYFCTKKLHFQSGITLKLLIYQNNFMENFLPRIHPLSICVFVLNMKFPTPNANAHMGTISLFCFLDYYKLLSKFKVQSLLTNLRGEMHQ